MLFALQLGENFAMPYANSVFKFLYHYIYFLKVKCRTWEDDELETRSILLKQLDIRVEIFKPYVLPISCNANLNSCEFKQKGTFNFSNFTWYMD